MYLKEDSQLWERVEVIAGEQGFAVYDLEIHGGGSGLRVTIFSESGVKSSDCSKICKELRATLAVDGEELGVSTDPQLEVSSPGVNRVLRTARHFENAQGERIRAVLKETNTAGKGSSVRGTLESILSDVVEIRVEDSEELLKFSLAEIKRAHVDFKFD